MREKEWTHFQLDSSFLSTGSRLEVKKTPRSAKIESSSVGESEQREEKEQRIRH